MGCCEIVDRTKKTKQKHTVKQIPRPSLYERMAGNNPVASRPAGERQIGLNEYLAMMKIVDSDKCLICNSAVERETAAALSITYSALASSESGADCMQADENNTHYRKRACR